MRQALAALLLLLAACTGGEEPGRADARPVCEPPMAAPPAFAPLDSFEEEYRTHVGVRLGFRDPEDRELHLFAGIPGEFGEGLPEGGSLTLAAGRSGFIAGDPATKVWVVIWDEGDICDPRAVLSNGFSRNGFLLVLENAGITPPQE